MLSAAAHGKEFCASTLHQSPMHINEFYLKTFRPADLASDPA